MIGFLETVDGSYPLSAISYIGVERRTGNLGERLVIVRDGGGQTKRLELFNDEVEELFRRPTSLMPAASGTSLISVDGREQTPSVWRDHVIAWSVCLDGFMRPVTPRGVNGGSAGPTYVELPDGRIEGVGDWINPPSFDSAELMIAFFEREKRCSGEEAGS